MPTGSAKFAFSLLTSGVALMRSDVRLKENSKVVEIYGTREIHFNGNQTIHLTMTRVDQKALLLDLFFAERDMFNHFAASGLMETIVDTYFKQQCHHTTQRGKSSPRSRARTVQALIASKKGTVQLHARSVDQPKLISRLTLDVTHFPSVTKQLQHFDVNSVCERLTLLALLNQIGNSDKSLVAMLIDLNLCSTYLSKLEGRAADIQTGVT